MIDFGCGSGRYTVAALKLGYEVMAVDYARRCLEVTADRVRNINRQATFIQNNANDIPIETASIDVDVAL